MPKYFGLSPASSSWCLPSNEDDDFSFQTNFLAHVLQGIQYQFIEATIYPPTVFLESQRKFRNAGGAHSRCVKFTLCSRSRCQAEIGPNGCWPIPRPLIWRSQCNCWSLTTGAEGQVRLCGFTHLAGDLFEHRCRNIVYEWCSKLMPRTEEQFVYNLTSCTLLPICA